MNTQPCNPAAVSGESLRAKADRAARSARHLLELGDLDGACDRAYFALLFCTRAVVLAFDRDASKDLGTPLTALTDRAEMLRHKANFEAGSVSQVDAAVLLDEMEAVLAQAWAAIAHVGKSR